MRPRRMDAVGHAELRQGTAAAGHGHRPRLRAGAIPQHPRGRGVLEIMVTANTSAKRAPRKRHAVSGPAVGADHLPSAAELRHIAEKIFRLSEADETEISVDTGVDALTRFANNVIHQNVAEEFLSISVRTVFDGRTARATTNKTDDESLRRVVAASSTLARCQPKIPDLLPMPGPQKYPRVERYFGATAAATPQDRARIVAAVCKTA